MLTAQVDLGATNFGLKTFDLIKFDLNLYRSFVHSSILKPYEDNN